MAAGIGDRAKNVHAVRPGVLLTIGQRASHGGALRGVATAAVACWLALALAPAAFGGTLAWGSSGPAVKRLNERLYHLSYLGAARVGRRFTRATFYAVMAFQKFERLKPDGIVGPRTSVALRTAYRPRPPRFGGERRVDVILSRQLAFLVSEAGRVRRTLSVSTGKAGFRTPTGRFRVYRRERWSWSPTYRAWLPWAEYFKGGNAIHGYPRVPAYPASHGCVRVPLPFARRVWRFSRMNTRVRVFGTMSNAR